MAREDHFQFPNDPSFADIYNRAKSHPEWSRVHFREGVFAQSAELNDAQEIDAAGRRRIGDMVAADGDRISEANIVNQGSGTYLLLAGEVYVQGDVLPVAQATLTDVPQTGTVAIGVRLQSAITTHEQDADLLGLHPGTEAEGEPGAIREAKSLVWGYEGDEGEGELFRVYTVVNGDVIDQSPPPNLSDVNQQIANYDRRAHGNYIAEGCQVSVLTPVNNAQIFSIAAGVANIQGYARSREADIRLTVPETPDLEQVDLEAHTWVDVAGSCTFKPRRTPVAAVQKVIVTKQITESIARGTVANTADTLGNSSVQSIVSVTQGATTFVAGDDYTLVGDQISWAPGGAEPATSSTYSVTYQYLDEVPVDALTATTVTASGGLDGGLCFLSYTYKLPRKDRVCLDRSGQAVYVKGKSSRNPEAPPRQADLLSLAVVTNTWVGAALVDNNGTRSVSFDGIRVVINKLFDALDLIALDRLQMKIALREPVAKRGVFVDPFVDDRWRDAGEAQTLSAFYGALQLPVTPAFHPVALDAPVTLSYVEEAVIRQETWSECRKIAPYITGEIPPLEIEITPFQDFWTETEVVWTSGSTASFGAGTNARLVSVEASVQKLESEARFLRELTIQYTIRGLGDGEPVDTLTFDGIDMMPGGGLVGNDDGIATGSFVIPAGVPSGRKIVRAVSDTGRAASTTFTGVGTVETFQQTLTNIYELFTPEPPVVVNNVTQTTIVEAPDAGDGGFNDLDGGQAGNADDPTAQSFVLSQSRHLTSIDIHCCAVGDRSFPVVVELVRMRDGQPTRDVVAQAVVSMATIQAGQWLKCPLQVPVFIPKDVYFAWVLKTGHSGHSLHVARLGGYDETNEKFITAQPYTLGDFFDGSNGVSWLVHPDLDIAMRVNGAKFGPTTRTVPLGTFAGTNVSDIMIRANVIIPSATCRALFRVQCGSEDPILLEANQTFPRTSFFTGNVKVDLLLWGTETLSPIVSRDILVVLGTLETTGRYVSRAGVFGVDGELSRVRALFASTLPTGSTATVKIDQVDDNFEALTLARSETLADGTVEREYEKENWDGIEGRLEITLTGTPAARPALYDLRAWSIEEIA